MRRIVFLAVLGAAASGACGGTDEPVGGVLDTGLDGPTKIADLTTEQGRQFCSRAVAYGQAVLPDELVFRFACVLAAFIGAGGGFDEAQCESEVEACLESSPEQAPAPLACELLPETAPDCDATVSQLELCISATARVSRDFVERLTCDLVSSSLDDLRELYDAYDLPPPECDAIVDLCPELVFGATL